MKSQENEEVFEVPITVNFDQKHIIGTAKVVLTEEQRIQIGEGSYTFAPGFVVKDYELTDDCVLFTDVELIEISLIPNYNPPQIKRKHKPNDNDNNTNSIKD